MPLNKAKILCVDDEPLNLKLYQAILTGLPAEVIPVDNGGTAWEKIKEENFDLILLDVMIPEINGFELCKKIKEDPSLAVIPVIMVTSLSEKKFRLRGIENHCDDFFVKPFDKELLIARARSLLNKKNATQSFQLFHSQIEAASDFTLELFDQFNPLAFNFENTLDRVSEEMLKAMKEEGNPPEILLVGNAGEEEWGWVHFEIPFNELLRSPLNLNLDTTFSHIKEKFPFFFSFHREEAEAKGFQPMIEELEQVPGLTVMVNHLQGYLSDSLAIIALNRKPQIIPFSAQILKSYTISHCFLYLSQQSCRESGSGTQYTIQSLVRAAEGIASEQKNHLIRVGKFCALIAQHMKMPEPFIEAIHSQALLHDIGNLLLPQQLLDKTGELEFQEWEVIRRHPILGAHIIGTHPRLKMARAIALTHHENWDGSGYPNWLEGQKIPIEGRIAGLADRYDAIRTPRSYKPAIDHETTMKIIQTGNERIHPNHFDPQVFEAFLELADQFAEIYSTFEKEAADHGV